MRTITRLTACLLVLLLLPAAQALAIHATEGPSSGATAVPHRLVIKFEPAAAVGPAKSVNGALRTGHAALDALHARLGARSQEALLKPVQRQAAGHPLRDVYLVELPPGADLDAAAREYARLGAVAYAHPDRQVQLYDLPPGDGFIIQPPPPKAPTDPLFRYQWPMNNRGQAYFHVERYPDCGNDVQTTATGTFDADLDYPEVYRNPPADPRQVVVAIVDTGVDWDHPELAGKIWQNPGEVPDNGIDDDHNGYVDDVVGWDFSGNDEYGLPLWEDNDPTDTHGHGTHCAGIVAAGMDNDIGISGIVPDARIMCLKFYPLMTLSMAAQAIVYAAENGADVMNMSWGMPSEMPVVEDALVFARALGVVLVAAAGNDGYQVLNYPASYAQTISVAATDSDDHVTSFSTYNSCITVAAPGLSILSLRADGTDMYGPCEADVHVVQDLYYLASGTSMSAPHVVGVAAYLRSASAGLGPDETEEILRNTADDLVDPFGDGGSYPGWDMYSGEGRVNLRSALDGVHRVHAILTSPASFEVVGGTVEVRGTAAGADFSGYELAYGGGGAPTSWYPIASSSAPVTDGVLGTWDAGSREGLYTLRLAVNGHNYAYARVFVANLAVAGISAPASGETVGGTPAIIGTGICQDFDRIEVEYGDSHANGPWYGIATVTTPVYHDKLADWEAFELAEGPYALRVSVYSSQGLEADQSIVVVVEQPGDRWTVALDEPLGRTANYGDFDGDGANEIILGTAEGIRVFDTDGNPKTTGLPAFPAGDFRVAIAVGSLDGDGVDDIVAVGGDGTLYCWRSGAADWDRDLGLAPFNQYQGSSDANIPKVFLQDMDGDGVDEIHYYPGGNSSAPWYYDVYRHDGSHWNASFPLPRQYRQCLPADLDGDGLCEIYGCGTGTGLAQFGPTGVLQTILPLEVDGVGLAGATLSAADIDGDGKVELIVQGGIDPPAGVDSHWVFAVDEGPVVMAGWPHSLNISTFLLPSQAAFGDLDGDGDLEYVTTHYDLSHGHVHAWHLDGTPLLTGGSESGFFASTPNPAKLASPVLVDADGSGVTDILAVSVADLWLTYDKELIHAWAADGDQLAGYPQVTASGIAFLSGQFPVPVVGDVDLDGDLDLIHVSIGQRLTLIEYPGIAFDPALAPCPMWRGNRRLNATWLPGASKVAGGANVAGSAASPRRFALAPNYPNPFNPSTVISFSLPDDAPVRLEIFDVSGRKVARLVDGVLAQGHHQIRWNGTGDDGQGVASGVYFYRLHANGHVATRKMTLMK